MVTISELCHATSRALGLVAVVGTLIFANPQAALADKGGSHGGDSGGSDSGGSDSGDSGGGHGSDDSGDSGSSSHGGKGGDDGKGGGKSGEGRKGSAERSYEGGWRARIKNGRYEVFDPAGRLVIRRKARNSDYGTF